MKTFTLFELDNLYWTDDLYGSHLQFLGRDLGQFSERVIEGEIRGHIILLGRGDNLGARLEILASGKIVTLTSDAVR